MKNSKLKDLIFCALFVALVAVGVFIRIPVGPEIFTLQFFFTLLAGLLLGSRLGAMAVLVYILLGLLGIPVFAEGGGPGYILQPTFGYLVAFVLQAWLTGYLSRRLPVVSVGWVLAVNLAGMAVVYVLGMTAFYWVSVYVLKTSVAFWPFILYGGILQAPGDFCLCVLSAVVAVRCYRARLWLAMPAAKDAHQEHLQEKEA